MSVPGVLILSRCLNFRLKQSKTISRVMSCVIIYPMELSPVPLSDPPENMTGSHIRFLFGLASDGVYMAFSVTRETVVSYTAFPPLPGKTWRYLSVALFLKSPSAGVTRYPCPVEPGLSSCPKARDRLHQSQIALYRKKTLSSNRTCKIVKNHVYCQSTKGGVTHL